MALTTHLYGYVSRTVQGRGDSYYRIGAVRVINGNKDALQAFVFGSHRYKVDLYRKEDTLYASCTCPYFEGEGGSCKHIWATLLAGEKRSYLRGEDNSDPLRLIGL